MIKIAPKLLLDNIKRKFNAKSKKQKALIYSGAALIVIIIAAICILPTILNAPDGATVRTFRICVRCAKDYSITRRDSSYESLEKGLIAMGMYRNKNGQFNPGMSDEEFQELAAKYPLNQFIEQMEYIESAMDHFDKDYLPSKFVRQYMKTLGATEYTLSNISQLNYGDWYEKNPNSQPQAGVTKEHGGYNSGPDNIPVYEDRENVTTVSYYGDFAVEHLNGWDYDEGMYKWINGVFYDVAPSWKKVSETTLWYKGKYRLDTDTILFLYEDSMYYMGGESTDGSIYALD